MKNKPLMIELMQRYVQLGAMLPSQEQVEAGERHDDARLILKEMQAVQAQIDAILKKKK